MESQQGRVALVTGGAQGIGKGIALVLLERGWSVVLADVDGDAGEESARELQDARHGRDGAGRVAFVHTDVGDETSVRACVSRALGWAGRLDAAVNNAGIARVRRAPPESLPLEEWNRMLAVNLTGTFLVARHAAAALRAVRGSIVNIASTRALQSEPHTEAYSASKGGVVALTHALAASLGPEVRVNCVSPGWIEVSDWQKAGRRRPPQLRPEDHAQHPAGRVGTPRDIGAVVAWLVSEEAGFVTGQNFVVDGGMTAKMIYVP